MNHALSQLKHRHLQGEIGGVVSVCSSHPMVLRTALSMAREKNVLLLVEATANQVNQFGGYTSMHPVHFVRHVGELSLAAGISDSRVIIGADHLGPLAWKHEPASAAMQKSEELVRQCIRAGYHKIHLDTGARCADDPGPLLPLELTAQRAARLCRVAEETYKELGGDRAQPVYVIGNEVPAPGGALEQGRALEITGPEQLMSSLEAYKEAFERAGAAAAWQRVLAVVVQPGVDFGDREVAGYRPERAARLSSAHDRLPGIMTYEIHATDYQLAADLRRMVADHFILLKVGPCLTFALRQALYALAEIEAALPHSGRASNLKGAMDHLMTEQPQHWRAFYTGTPEDLLYLRHYSLRDRIRYYWSYPEAQQAVQRLAENLQSRRIPSALLQQYLPDLYPDIHSGDRPLDPQAVLQLRIRQALQPYLKACGQ